MAGYDVVAAVAVVLAADKDGAKITLPTPPDEATAYAVQHRLSAAWGEIGGWKVGAAGPEAPPSAAPLRKSGILASPATIPAGTATDRLVESEIAFRIGRDLPPRAAPYEREEILAAIASCHPVIEVVHFRLAEGISAPALAKLAEGIGHAALIVGPEVPGWRQIDFAGLAVTQTITGAEPLRRIGNPAGDMIRLIAWLADEGAVWAGGLHAGQIVTCGSWTGATPVPAGGGMTGAFAGLPAVTVTFAAS